MKIFTKKINSKVGLPAGDLTYLGERKRRDTRIRIINYNETDYKEDIVTEINDQNKIVKADKNTWIDIEGFGDIEKIKQIGNLFDIHELIIEDTFNTDHIPKYEENDDYLLFILKSFSEKGGAIKESQVTLLLKNNLVVSFQEEPNSIITPKIERIRNATGRSRRKKGDYLFFVLLDAFIDSYYSYFENLREETNNLDSKILIDQSKNHIQEIYALKNKLTSIRKNLFPLKTAINELLSNELELINSDNIKYFNDCKDHVNELIEYYYSFEAAINNLISFNESNLANNTNKIMKVLTIIATLFIPLTFIAGIYGMNFENMPELKLEFGYYYSLILMLIISLTILGFMKWKKWL
jgi:magnesium transporter